ncbi:MAG: hypothetical protein WBX06_01700 [Acidobacteriaceae bacterium]
MRRESALSEEIDPASDSSILRRAAGAGAAPPRLSFMLPDVCILQGYMQNARRSFLVVMLRACGVAPEGGADRNFNVAGITARTGGGMIRPMSGVRFFSIWTGVFAALGVVVPIVLTVCFLIFHANFGKNAATLWPSSLMFMALDTPTLAARSTVISVYAVAIAENALLYAIVGAVTWPLAYFLRRAFSSWHSAN